MNEDQIQAMARAKKRAFSRERCEELRAIGLTLKDQADTDLVEEAVELLLDVRQGFRGGRRMVRGSRHWSDEEMEQIMLDGRQPPGMGDTQADERY